MHTKVPRIDQIRFDSRTESKTWAVHTDLQALARQHDGEEQPVPGCLPASLEDLNIWEVCSGQPRLLDRMAIRRYNGGEEETHDPGDDGEIVGRS